MTLAQPLRPEDDQLYMCYMFFNPRRRTRVSACGVHRGRGGCQCYVGVAPRWIVHHNARNTPNTPECQTCRHRRRQCTGKHNRAAEFRSLPNTEQSIVSCGRCVLYCLADSNGRGLSLKCMPFGWYPYPSFVRSYENQHCVVTRNDASTGLPPLPCKAQHATELHYTWGLRLQ